jgi:hypothetical protein
MSKVHGKVTFVSLDGKNLSSYGSNVEYGRTADSHDVTTFGNDAHIYNAGLTDGTATIEGVYESVSVTGGPAAVIRPLIGAASPVELIYRPEGTGSGKAENKGNVIVTGYTETSPVADMVRWQAQLQLAGPVTTTNQT